jgi:hypothetical protein
MMERREQLAPDKVKKVVQVTHGVDSYCQGCLEVDQNAERDRRGVY